MKRTSILAATILVCLSLASALPAGASALTSTGDGNWVWMNPLPQGNWIADLDFIDSQNGWAVGGPGVTLSTTDGGVTWTPGQWQRHPGGTTAPDFLALDVLDLTHAWVGASEGRAFGTADGGAGWARSALDAGAGTSLYDVAFTTFSTGCGVTAGGEIVRTTDAGATWTTIVTTVSGLYGIAFPTSATGVAVGSHGAIFRTTDGGGAWAKLGDTVAQTFRDVEFAGADIGWIAGDDGVVFRSTDRGANWTQCSSPTTQGLRAVAAGDADHAWVAGNTDGVYRTTDGGGSWQDASLNVASYFDSLTFSGLQNGWVGGGGGYMGRTTDGGVSWARQGSGELRPLYDVTAPATRAIAVGESGTILRTTDAGVTWQKRSSPASDALWSVDTAPGDVAVAVGNGGMAIRTTDAGDSWASIASVPATGTLRDVALRDSGNGWLAGSSGFMSGAPVVMKTTDAGATWTATPPGTSDALLSLCAPSDLVVYAGGANGSVIKTTDGGMGWGQLPVPDSEMWVAGMDFIDTQTGWICGNLGLLYATTDGGGSWQQQDSGTGWSLEDIDFVSPTVGFAVADKGTILYTCDAGAHWQSYVSGAGNDLVAVTGTDPSHVWVSGGYGALLSLRDELPPVTTATGVDDLWHTRGVTVTLTAADFQSSVASTEYRLQGAATWTPYAAPVTLGTPGVSTYDYRSTDSAGNVEPARAFTVRVTGRPAITRVRPASARRGAIVTILGSGFGSKRGGSFVKFGTRKCGKYVAWSNTRIRCRVPARARFGRIKVKVTTEVGTSNGKGFRVKR